GEVGLDQRRLVALGGGLLGSPAALEGIRCLDPLLALALEDGYGVALALLLVLLERAGEAPQRSDAVALARLHRRAGVGLDSFEDLVAHRPKSSEAAIRPLRCRRAASAGTWCRARGTRTRRRCRGTGRPPRRSWRSRARGSRGSAAPSPRSRARR